VRADGRELRQIEAAFDVTIGRRGASFRFQRRRRSAEKAAQAIEHFYNRAHDELSLDDIQLGLVELTRGRADEEGPALRTAALICVRAPRARANTSSRSAVTTSLSALARPHRKTYLAVACAVDALEREQVKRLVLTRPRWKPVSGSLPAGRPDTESRSLPASAVRRAV